LQSRVSMDHGSNPENSFVISEKTKRQMSEAPRDYSCSLGYYWITT